jgi:hypothetical protein
VEKANVVPAWNGGWRVECPRCVPVEGFVGLYTSREAAMSNGAAHMRSKHGVIGETW